MQRVVIVGATSLIAEHCARRWCAQPTHFVLAGRDAAKLERLAQDLAVRCPEGRVEIHTPSFDQPASISSFVESVWSQGPVDIVLIAHGTLPDQAQCQRDLVLTRDTLSVNAISPALFAEAFAARMAETDRGTIAVIGSVAGDRGRRSNYVYGAAKGLVDRYVQGLQHRFAATGVRVVLIKPGPTDTPMTANFRKPGVKLASPETVAGDIVRGINQGKAVVYTPWIWRWIMLIIVHIPRRVFNRLDL